MKKLTIILSFAVLASLWSCQGQLTPDKDLSSSMIALSAHVEDGPETRTAMEGISYPFTVAVWASTTSGTYPNGSANGTAASSYQVGKHVTAVFNQTSTTLNGPDNDGIRYPYIESPTPPAVMSPRVYFIGLYPATGWTTLSDGAGASFTFNGRDDVMYAPEVYGSSDPEVDDPTLTFSHLLTYLKFKIVAESADAQKAWGDLTSIKLKKQNNGEELKSSVSVTLNSPASSATFVTTVSELHLYVQNTNTYFPISAYTIPTSAAAPVAYVICAPVTASAEPGYNEYTLEISTKNRTSRLVGIDLKSIADELYTGSTMGKEFTVTLTFTLNSIAASATVTGWTTGGVGKTDVSE